MPEDPAALTTTWFDAWRTKDASAIARMMAPDYVYVAPNGSLMDRAAILAIATDPTYGITEGTHDDVTVIALGPDVAREATGVPACGPTDAPASGKRVHPRPSNRCSVSAQSLTRP